MSWFAERKRRREFFRTLRIAALEAEVGIESDHPELPDIRVVRNPNGLPWIKWVALGFPGEWEGSFDSGYIVRTYGGTQSECVKRAKQRLWETWVAKHEEPIRVSLVP